MQNALLQKHANTMNSNVLIKQYGSFLRLIQLLGFGIISNCCHYKFKSVIIRDVKKTVFST